MQFLTISKQPRCLHILRQAAVFVLLYSASDARADSCCFDPYIQESRCNIGIFAEGLYWYTSETVDWAYTLVEKGSSTEASYKTFAFDWAPGLRLGVTCDAQDSLFDMQAYYTKISAHASGKTSDPATPAFLAARLSLLEPFSLGGDARLEIDYNMFDLELGASIPTSSSLFFRPAVGLKGGWIDQKVYSNWATNDFVFGFVTASENIKQRFEGIGPKGAISGRWSFARPRIHLIGLFDMSYLWGYWTIEDRYVDSSDSTNFVKTSPRNFGAFALHTFLGIEWEPCFCCDVVQLKLKLGYEFETWLNQFQIFSNDSGSQCNNLSFQGVTFRVTACF